MNGHHFAILLMIPFVASISPRETANLRSRASLLQSPAFASIPRRFLHQAVSKLRCRKRWFANSCGSTPHFMSGKSSDMVTYGHIWRTAMDEPLAELPVTNSDIETNFSEYRRSLDIQVGGVSDEAVKTDISSVVRPMAKAATVVGAAAATIWTTLTKGPSDEEARVAPSLLPPLTHCLFDYMLLSSLPLSWFVTMLLPLLSSSRSRKTCGDGRKREGVPSYPRFRRASWRARHHARTRAHTQGARTTVRAPSTVRAPTSVRAPICRAWAGLT